MSVSEFAKLHNLERQAIYYHIKKMKMKVRLQNGIGKLSQKQMEKIRSRMKEENRLTAEK